MSFLRWRGALRFVHSHGAITECRASKKVKPNLLASEAKRSGLRKQRNQKRNIIIDIGQGRGKPAFGGRNTEVSTYLAVEGKDLPDRDRKGGKGKGGAIRCVSPHRGQGGEGSARLFTREN